MPARSRPPAAHLLAVLALAALLVALVQLWQLPMLVVWVYVGASIVALLAYGIDKLAARSAQRRTSESTLLSLGLLGGWPGAILGQQLFRHKTVKPAFRRAFWGTVVLNVVALIVVAFLLRP
jgi:uncharacterized membrane protein YsdA (DUF1294 family)